MRSALLSLAAALALASAGAAAPLNIVKDGVSPYEILVAKDALPITFRAAQDLQLYIRKATGVELPLRRADQPGDQPAILVGDGLLPKDFLQGLAPEGFRIKTLGRNLAISGRDTAGWGAESVHWRGASQCGTWYGVCQFLEGELGIRWFYPGEMGEYVPKAAALTVREQDFTDAPKMVYRCMGYLCEAGAPPSRVREVNEWCRRNRMGWSLIWSAAHSWLQFLPAEKYFKDHPDWYALVNGRRLAYDPLGPKICTTNPEVLDEFARIIIQFGKENPGVMFSLTPNDGGGFCECERCRALDRVKFPDGTPVLTDRIMTYANEIATRVCKVLPDQKFGLLAYSYYADPPTYVRLHPNVCIMNVLNGTGRVYYSEAIRRQHLEGQLMPWRSKVGNDFLGFYDHPEDFGNLDLPSCHPSVIAWTYENLAKVHVNAFSMNMGDSFAAAGLNHYLYLHMAWNPEADFQTLYTDALEKCYGPAAAPSVRDYFALVERHTAATIRADAACTFPTIIDAVYGGLYEEAAPLLQKAVAAAGDPGQRQRAQWLLDNLEYTRATADLYVDWKRLQVPGAKAGADDWRKLRDRAIVRAEEIQKQNQTNIHMAGICAQVTDTFNLPFKPEVYDRLLIEAAGGRNKVNVLKAAVAPKLDGNLGDAAWRNAAEMPVEFRKDDGSRADVKTRAKVIYDDRCLYIGVRCDDPKAADIKDSVTQRRGAVWDENCIDLFIDVKNDGAGSRQLIVNSLGTIADFAHEGAKDSDWDSQARTAVKRDATGWTLEIAIPLSALGVQKILPADVWGFNICRVRQTGQAAEYTCWSPTFGLFNQPRRFGYLIFKQ